MTIQDKFQSEWTLQQKHHEDYEKGALYCKFVALGLVGFSFGSSTPGWGLLGVILLCWLTEAIWRTYQNRTEARLLVLERDMHQPESVEASKPFNMHSDWASSRPSSGGLVNAYVQSAKKPTVAVVYAGLATLIILDKIF